MVTVGSGGKLQATGYRNLVGTVFKKKDPQIRIKVFNIITFSHMGSCPSSSPPVANRVGISALLDSSIPRLVMGNENIPLQEASWLFMLHVKLGGVIEANILIATWHLRLDHV